MIVSCPSCNKRYITKQYISGNFPPEYLPDKAKNYTSRKGAQAAHEAIRPTSVMHAPEEIKKFLTNDQYKLYRLIWERFVASQMTPARYDLTHITIQAGEITFLLKGKTLVFDGHTRVRKTAKDKE